MRCRPICMSAGIGFAGGVILAFVIIVTGPDDVLALDQETWRGVVLYPGLLAGHISYECCLAQVAGVDVGFWLSLVLGVAVMGLACAASVAVLTQAFMMVIGQPR